MVRQDGLWHLKAARLLCLLRALSRGPLISQTILALSDELLELIHVLLNVLRVEQTVSIDHLRTWARLLSDVHVHR